VRESSVRICKIDRIDKEALEAEVIVSDGTFEVLCFAHPLTYEEGSELNGPIRCLDATNIVKSDKNEYTVEKSADYFSYVLTGKLVDKINGLVMVGGLMFEVDKDMLPGDIKEGEYISFYCDRLDLY